MKPDLANNGNATLNIGYELGIPSPRIFAGLVIMALVNTGMTGLLLSCNDYLRESSLNI